MTTAIEQSGRPSGTERSIDVGVVQWVVAALLVGAGAVHLAMAPSHFGASTVEGMGFVVAAWLQIGLALAVVLRPSRAVAVAIIGLSGACIVAWAVSRTVGLPFGAHADHAETVTLVDGVTVAMEAATIVLAAMLLSRTVVAYRSGTAAFVAVVAVLVLTSAIIAAPEARNHSEVAHGGHTHGGQTAAASGASASGGAGHDHSTTAAVAVKDDKGLSALKNGHHAEMKLTKLSATDQAALDAQLAVTREVAKLYPTVASAMAAGYSRAGPFQPGLGAHYTNSRGALNPDGVMDDSDLRTPLSLLYSGTDATDELVGFMYYSMSATAPEGFAGTNDFWHSHTSICLRRGADGGTDAPFGMDSDVTEAQCQAAQGRLIRQTQYMVHVWTVPGYETTKKDGGPFAEVNPKLACSDGTYYSVPISEWPSHPYNICKAA